MKLTGENQSTRRKTWPSATLSTTNPTWTEPGSNPDLPGGMPAANRLSHGTAFCDGLTCCEKWFYIKYDLILGINIQWTLHRQYFLPSILLYSFFLHYIILCSFLSSIAAVLSPFCFDLFFCLYVYTCIQVISFLSTVPIYIIPNNQQSMTWTLGTDAVLVKASAVRFLNCLPSTTYSFVSQHIKGVIKGWIV
jgi:hypothetical protein